MALADFIEEPTLKRNIHAAYSDSMFTTEAPEMSTGEVLLGSVYRKLIFDLHDNSVDLSLIESLPSAFVTESELWSSLLLERGGLASPLKSGQRGPRPFRQLMPLVPQVAKHACVLGSHGRRWFPGNLLFDVLGAGAEPASSQTLLTSLAHSLAVGDNDDMFARFTESRLSSVTTASAPAPLVIDEKRQRAYRGRTSPLLSFNPAERFCRDLGSVLELKDKLTRRQWTVLVEAVLRIAMGTHVLWVCHANARCWEMVLSVTSGEPVPTESEVENKIWHSHRDSNSFLEVGRDAVPLIKQVLERHLFGRFGINLVLHKLEDAGNAWPLNQIIGYNAGSGRSSPQAVHAFLEHVANHRMSIDPVNPSQWLRSQCRDMCDKRLQLVKSDKGFTNNLLEFIRHSLGQIETENPEQKSYDQSYMLANRKRARGRSGPWLVQPGPAMLILLVHSCYRSQGDIPASLDDLRMHLADYGLLAPAGELADGQVGADLEKLGLVVDSPDAAGGRLLVAPF